MGEDAFPGGQLCARGLLQEGFRPDLGHSEPVQGGEGRGLMVLVGGGPSPQVLGTCKAREGEQVRRGTCHSTEPACSGAAEAGGAVAWHLCCCHGDYGGAN